MNLRNFFKRPRQTREQTATFSTELSKEHLADLVSLSPASLLNNTTNHFVRDDLHFLLIDDNEQFKSMLQTFFQKKGAATDCASDGEAGLRLFKENPRKYHAVLLDIHMPGMNGFAVAEEIRTQSLNTSVPIIAISGESELQNNQKTHFDYHFQKPFDLEKLVLILNKLVK